MELEKAKFTVHDLIRALYVVVPCTVAIIGFYIQTKVDISSLKGDISMLIQQHQDIVTSMKSIDNRLLTIENTLMIKRQVSDATKP